MVEKSSRSSLLIRISFLLLSAVPCAIVHGWAVWPLLTIWVVGGGARLTYRDRKVGIDCVLWGIFNVLVLRKELLHAVWKRRDTWFNVDWITVERLPGFLCGVALAVFGLLVVRRYGSNASVVPTPQGTYERTERWTLEHPRPWIFPCRTTHARMFPKRHAFGYSYLLCGFPIIPTSTTDDGMNVSDGKDRMMGSWWLRVRAEDYLKRGNGAVGFYRKLRAFMREQVCISSAK
jgi:hypothetical protein